MKIKSRLFWIIISAIIFTGLISCGNKGQSVENPIDKLISKLQVPEGVKKETFDNYMELYLQKWENYQVDSQAVLKVFESYFGTSPYRVIWKWDTDGHGKISYLGVEECPGIYKGIKRGILVTEDGLIKMIIDRNKGFYNDSDKIYNFEKMGLRKDEIECIRLLFIRKDVELKQINVNNSMWVTGGFVFQLIDKDFDLITHRKDINAPYLFYSIGIYLQGLQEKDWKVSYEMFNPVAEPATIYKEEKESIDKYRENKTKGIVVKPINFDPDSVK